MPIDELSPLNYATVAKFAEQFASASGIRELDNFEQAIRLLGGRVSRLSLEEWSSAVPPVVYSCDGQQHGFSVAIPAFSPALEKFLLGSALGHWILHTAEGRRELSVSRGETSFVAQEALWFSLCILLPDELFIAAASRKGVEDEVLSALFKIPPTLLSIKRKILQKNGLLCSSALA